MKCLYAGSFDPVTAGHMDIIERAAKKFDFVYVGVCHNVDKRCTFTTEERVRMIEKCCKKLSNVTVVSHEGLTVHLAKKLGADVMIRGVRNGNDMDSEMTLARINKRLCPEIETIFFPASSGMEDVSSGAVRQLLFFHEKADMFLPAEILQEVKDKFVK